VCTIPGTSTGTKFADGAATGGSLHVANRLWRQDGEGLG
jgi:hypothetical protein